MTGASLLLPLIRVGVERMATSDVEQPNLCCRKHILQCAQDITSSQCSVRPAFWPRTRRMMNPDRHRWPL